MAGHIVDTYGQETINIIEKLATKAYSQALSNFEKLDKTSSLNRDNIQAINDVLMKIDRLFNHVIAVGDVEFERLLLCFVLSVSVNDMIVDLPKFLNQQQRGDLL